MQRVAAGYAMGMNGRARSGMMSQFYTEHETLGRAGSTGEPVHRPSSHLVLTTRPVTPISPACPARKLHRASSRSRGSGPGQSSRHETHTRLSCLDVVLIGLSLLQWPGGRSTERHKQLDRALRRWLRQRWRCRAATDRPVSVPRTLRNRSSPGLEKWHENCHHSPGDGGSMGPSALPGHKVINQC